MLVEKADTVKHGQTDTKVHSTIPLNVPLTKVDESAFSKAETAASPPLAVPKAETAGDKTSTPACEPDMKPLSYTEPKCPVVWCKCRMEEFHDFVTKYDNLIPAPHGTSPGPYVAVDLETATQLFGSHMRPFWVFFDFRPSKPIEISMPAKTYEKLVLPPTADALKICRHDYALELPLILDLKTAAVSPNIPKQVAGGVVVVTTEPKLLRTITTHRWIVLLEGFVGAGRNSSVFKGELFTLEDNALPLGCGRHPEDSFGNLGNRRRFLRNPPKRSQKLRYCSKDPVSRSRPHRALYMIGVAGLGISKASTPATWTRQSCTPMS